MEIMSCKKLELDVHNYVLTQHTEKHEKTRRQKKSGHKNVDGVAEK